MISPTELSRSLLLQSRIQAHGVSLGNEILLPIMLPSALKFLDNDTKCAELLHFHCTTCNPLSLFYITIHTRVAEQNSLHSSSSSSLSEMVAPERSIYCSFGIPCWNSLLCTVGTAGTVGSDFHVDRILERRSYLVVVVVVDRVRSSSL